MEKNVEEWPITKSCVGHCDSIYIENIYSPQIQNIKTVKEPVMGN